MTPLEVYRQLYTNLKKAAILSKNSDYTEDKASRKANIYAVKYTWFYYTLPKHHLEETLKDIKRNIT